MKKRVKENQQKKLILWCRRKWLCNKINGKTKTSNKNRQRCALFLSLSLFFYFSFFSSDRRCQICFALFSKSFLFYFERLHHLYIISFDYVDLHLLWSAPICFSVSCTGPSQCLYLPFIRIQSTFFVALLLRWMANMFRSRLNPLMV